MSQLFTVHTNLKFY